MAKKNYTGKLKKLLSSNDSTSVWKGLKAVTSYKTPPPSTEANQQLAEGLNNFYSRFQKQKPGLTPHTHSDRLTTQPSTPSPSLPPTVPQPVIKICEDDVSKVFRRQKIRKAKGPDGVSPACLKACAVQLSSIFTLIFNRSLELCEVPSCFKRSTIIPVPKKPKIRPTWLQTCCFNVCGDEVIWEARVGPPEGHYWTLAGPPAVCLPSKQVCGWCSQHGIALHPPTSGQTRDLCKDPVCGLQLRFQHHHPGHPSE